MKSHITLKTAQDIAQALNSSGYNYFGAKAKAWEGSVGIRIYFGSDYLTLEPSGEIHNRRHGRARALTIGHEAVEAAQSVNLNAAR